MASKGGTKAHGKIVRIAVPAPAVRAKSPAKKERPLERLVKRVREPMKASTVGKKADNKKPIAPTALLANRTKLTAVTDKRPPTGLAPFHIDQKLFPITNELVEPSNPLETKYQRMFHYESLRDRWFSFPIDCVTRDKLTSPTNGTGKRATVKHVWRHARTPLEPTQVKVLEQTLLAVPRDTFFPIVPVYNISRDLTATQRIQLFGGNANEPLLVRIYENDNRLVQTLLLTQLRAPS